HLNPPLLFSFLSPAAATTVIYALSLHDALPIFVWGQLGLATLVTFTIAWAYWHYARQAWGIARLYQRRASTTRADYYALAIVNVDRKSTRLNSSHRTISYAVFCLKKKTNNEHNL